MPMAIPRSLMLSTAVAWTLNVTGEAKSLKLPTVETKTAL